jgi:uncharacterized protein YkwD
MRRALTIALLAASLLLSPLVGQTALAATMPVNHAQFMTRVIDLVNVERQRVGLQPLTANGPLRRTLPSGRARQSRSWRPGWAQQATAPTS